MNIHLEKKLRLLITKQCHRSCPGCCNKDWNLDALEIETDFSGYSEILLTGGEPMLDLLQTTKIINRLRYLTNAKIYMYTAYIPSVFAMNLMVGLLDGITLTLHDSSDVCSFENYNRCLPKIYHTKSLRLNIFKGVELSSSSISELWEVKYDMEWIKNCPLPQNEVFKRYR